MEGKLHDLEAMAAAWAERQRGNVTRSQLLAAGYSGNVIDERIRRGSLHVQLPGVYMVGHRVELPLGRECAALLYCAPRAMLSHLTAGRLWGLPVPRPAEVHVTVLGHQRRSRPGLKVYSLGELGPHELRRYEGLPITSPSLTLLDLAGCVSEDCLAAALNEARVQNLVNDGEPHETLRAHPNRRGGRALAKLLSSEAAEFTVESEAERLCLELMLEHGLKPDAAGAAIGPYRVDFLYEAERLIVEVDGYRYHRTQQRFVRDRRRRAELLARGYEVFPVTWHDLVDQSDRSMHRLRSALRERRRVLPALRE